MLVRLWKYRLREERDSIAFMRRQDLAGRTVLDVGANKGIYAYWMSEQVGSRGRVIAFEPQPDLRPHLDDLKRTFHLDNVDIVSKGLSNRTGVVSLRRDKPGSLGATLDAELGLADPSRLVESIAVDVLTLDDYCRDAGIDSIAFIKCDVEGHELPVFQGARDVLQSNRPQLLFECHHSEAERGELFAFLVDIGYAGWFVHDGRLVPYQQFAAFPYRKASIRFRNYMFSHRHAPARR